MVSSFFKYFPLACTFIILSNAQVAPAYTPYSLDHSEVILNQADIHVEHIHKEYSFMDHARITIQDNAYIYRLSISFDSIQSGHLSIRNWNVPSSAMLFIFNDNTSYTGPYIKSNEEHLMSGRFISKQLILEYIMMILFLK